MSTTEERENRQMLEVLPDGLRIVEEFIQIIPLGFPGFTNHQILCIPSTATTKAMEQRRKGRADRLLKMAKLLHNTSAKIDGIEYYP